MVKRSCEGTILGDPGADRGGKGKSKRAKENGDKEKHSMARRAPGDTFLPVSKSRGSSQFCLVPEILCVFLPNQRSAGREVVSCFFTQK